MSDGWVVSECLMRQMQETLVRLGVPLTVLWTPNPNEAVHGEIKHKILYIYDLRQADALATFMHEIIEFKLKEVTKVYRTMVNCLIEGYEKLAYSEKEEFIEFLPKLMDIQNLAGSAVELSITPPQDGTLNAEDGKAKPAKRFS